MTVSAAGIAVALAACGSSGNNNTASSSNVSSITVWTFFNTPQLKAALNSFIGIFEKAHPSVKVQTLYIPYAQLPGKVVSAAATGTGPDVVVYVPSDTAKLASAGGLAPVDSYWDSYPDKSLFPATARAKLDGKTYGTVGGVDVLGLWYNQDLMKKLGISNPPSTLSELEQDMATAKKAGYLGITFSGTPDNVGEWQANPWATMEGFSYAHPAVTPLEKTFQLARSWVADGYVPKSVPTAGQDVAFTQWLAGNVLFAENGEWNTTEAQQNAKFKYGVAPLPIGPDGKTYLSGWALGVGAFSKAQSLDWDFVSGAVLSKDGEVAALKNAGLIPLRGDVINSPAVQSAPVTKAFMQIAAKYGQPYPDSNVPPNNVGQSQLVFGQAWSAVLSGQQSPQAAAASLVSQLTPLVAK